MSGILPSRKGPEDPEGESRREAERAEEESMTVIKRIAIAVGTLLTLALAGGAHFKF
jgi:hypothetical protein